MIAYLRHLFAKRGREREHFHATFLDQKRCYLGDRVLVSGSFDSLRVKMRTLFSEALSLDTRAIILAHNHPSGNCRPSRRDIEATRQLADFAKGLEIELLDHFIVTDSAIYSMRLGGDL